MAIQIGEKPSPTFNQPLELLSDCHRRVERFLKTLLLVTQQARGGALNGQQREALETALRYFQEAAPKHTADEEESLFPRLRAAGGDLAQTALAKIQALEADHQIAKTGHTTVDQIGRRWLKDNSLAPAEVEELAGNLEALDSIYSRHIAMEDNEVFPLASKVLNREQLDAVGREMAERRGQKIRN